MPFPKTLRLDNATDLYYGTPVTTPTSEHVLQEGLGGELEVEGLIDRTTNNKLGGTLDASLTESFAWVRCLLGLSTSYARPIWVAAASGDYDILGDSPTRKAVKGPPWTVETEPDGTRWVKIVADDKEQAKNIANHARKALKVSDDRVGTVRLARVREFAPSIPVEARMGGPLDLRAVAKSCVNALAVCRAPAAVLAGSFEAIRSYVRYGVEHHKALLAGGADPQPAYACWDSRSELFAGLPAACALGPVDHRLVLRGCGDHHTVYATVELFGHLPVSVLLTDAWYGPDFCWGLVTDPRPDCKRHWRGELGLDVRPALTADNVLAHATEPDKLKTAVQALARPLAAMVAERDTSRMARKSSPVRSAPRTASPSQRKWWVGRRRRLPRRSSHAGTASAPKP